jgi:hypothetical protein
MRAIALEPTPVEACRFETFTDVDCLVCINLLKLLFIVVFIPCSLHHT